MNNLDFLKLDFSTGLAKNEVIFKGQKYRITVLSERLIRLEYSEEGLFFDGLSEQIINRNFPLPHFDVEQDEYVLTISTKYFRLRYKKEAPFKGSKMAPFANLEIKLLETDKSWYFSHPEARNFQTSGYGYDEKNNKMDRQQGLYSVDGFASIDDSNTMMFTNDGRLAKPVKQRVDTYVFLYRRDFGMCLKDYYTLTGAPTLIPRYAYGIWWNRNTIYNQEDVEEIVQDFNRNRIPLSIILLGEYWHLKDKDNLDKLSTGFTFNRNLFKEPNLLVKYLHERGIRLGLQLDQSEGIMPHEEGYNNVQAALNQTFNKPIPFNVFNKILVQSYFSFLINPLKNLGTDFFWIDYRNTKDLTTLRAISYYHLKDMDQNIKTRPLIMAKNGGIASHRYSVLYSGETKVSWDTLKELPYFNSLACNKGISYWSHDVGGYKNGIEDNELYTRHVQLATYSPIFRFSAKKGHYYKREPWKWDAQTLNITRDYANLRHRMIPYIYSESYKYYRYGNPLVKPLYYSIPLVYDEPTYKNEYYFGSELLVAPITSKKDIVMNRAVEKIFLPEGTWYDARTGKKFIGNRKYTIFYKDEDYPVFAKNGSILTYGELKANLNVTDVPDALEIHVFPGKSNTYQLYEDDGISNYYNEGYYLITNIDYNYLQNNYTLIIRPLEGKTGIIPQLRDYKIRFRNTREADIVDVYLDNKKIVSKSYVDESDFVVELDDIPTTNQLTINCKGRDIEIDAIRIINDEIDSIISDLHLATRLKEKIASIIFNTITIDKKRVQIRKLKKDGVDKKFIKMFLRLLEYAAEL